MSAGQQRIDDASAARDELTSISYTLASRAKAAATMGMATLAEDLWALAADVRTAADKLHKCWSDELHAYCDAVQQGSTNMLNAALAGCELGRRAG